MKVSEIETPALILDINKLKHNMNVMNSCIADSNAKLRPHFKTNKTLEIVKLQMQNGAKGITCSKLSEAEILVNAGISDILIANQIVQPSKIKRLAELAKKTHLIVCVDNEDNILELSRAAIEEGTTIFIYIEYEAGMKRCGVESKEEFLHLAQLVTKCDGLVFEGIQAYAGQLSHEENVSYKEKEVEKTVKKVKELKEYTENFGITVKEISGASTCTSFLKAASGVYTEIQAGSYVFMDAALSGCSLPFLSSLFIETTIISKKSDRIVIDTGAKSLGLDQCYPIFLNYENCQYSLSEEHFSIYGQNLGGKIGEHVRLIPGHCCTTVNIYDKMYVIDKDNIIDEWKIDGRGKSI